MTYKTRLSFLIIVDSMIVLSAIYIGYFMFNPYLGIFTYPFLMVSSISLLFFHHLFASIYQLYKKAWEYASIGELVSVFKAISFTIVSTAVVQLVILGNIYVRVLFVTWMLHMLLIGGSRFAWRIFRDSFFKKTSKQHRTLIIGAGSAGSMVVRQLIKNQDAELTPVCFIDDDSKKHNLQIFGVPVVGGSDRIEEAVRSFEIENIIIAIPSLSKKELNKIYTECSKTKAKTQIMPMLEDLMLGKISVSNLREVQVEDLLGREPVELDMKSISESITDKVVLVTGAGGSIGSEICRQVSEFKPKKLVLLGHGENSIYLIDMELRTKYIKQFEIVPVIADVQDRGRMFDVISTFKPDVIYHAAAHKHVPLMEYNPKEAVKNNIIGTKNVAEAADIFGVKAFVMVSTDKAVNPPNVMGASKRFAEMVIQSLAVKSNTRFVAVRFGNVLGSRGSVIPLFKKQIQAGGPVTVTHPDMTRYFMTIPEASRLVIQAGSLARGGEIFVLDMGEPVKIVDLAKNLIKLSGFSVDEIGIHYAGIRPGEKMYEELLNENEVHEEQVFPKIRVGKAVVLDYQIIQHLINQYEQMSVDEMREYLLKYANKKAVEELQGEVVV